MTSFLQYIKENFQKEAPLSPSDPIKKGTRVAVHAKHDVGPIKFLLTTNDDTTASQLIDQIKLEDPCIVTAVVYVNNEGDQIQEDSNMPYRRGKLKIRKRKSIRTSIEEDEQQTTPQQTQSPAAQQQQANIDRMISQRQMQMSSLRQNAERAQQQVQAKQKEIDNLMRQKAAIH